MTKKKEWLPEELSEYPVERGVPVPIRTRRYPWGKMRIGDSFAVRDFEGTTISEVDHSMRTAARNWGKRKRTSGRKFMIRIVKETDSAGNVIEDPITGKPKKYLRCWRIE